MTLHENRKFIVIDGVETSKVVEKSNEHIESSQFHSNPMYQKLLNFKNLQDAQKKKFSVDDLFKLC